jgi:phage shock protein A
MGIFQRVSDIISANLNEMAEHFENPEQMLKQAIREMESSITAATNETAKALANEKLLGRELENNQTQASRWEKRAEQAVSSGDDELAKKALSRKAEHEKLVDALEDQLKSATSASSSLKRQLEAMKAKLAEAKRSLATLGARSRAAEFRRKMQTVGAGIATELDRDAFAKFDRLRSRVEQAEAEAEAMAELRGPWRGPAEFGDDFDGGDDMELESSGSDSIAAELAELKRKLKK